MKAIYQITAKQIIVLALVTAVFAASGVLFYDRFGSALLGRWAGAKSGKGAEETQIRALTDPSVATDEKNNREVYDAVSPGVVNITSTVYVQDFFDVVPQKGSGSGSISSGSRTGWTWVVACPSSRSASELKKVGLRASSYTGPLRAKWNKNGRNGGSSSTG